jgi:hypothetical protein
MGQTQKEGDYVDVSDRPEKKNFQFFFFFLGVLGAMI